MGEQEIFHSREEEFSLVFSKDQWKIKERHYRNGYGIRALEKGRIGFGYCDRTEDLARAMESARTLARFSPSTSFSFSASPASTAVQTENPRLRNLSPEELKGMLDSLLDEARKYADTFRVYATIRHEEVNLQNPFFEKRYAKDGFDLYAEATVEDGFGFYHFSGMDLPRKTWESSGEEIGTMARTMRGAKKLPPGKYPVVFSPSAFADILGVLLPSFSGDWKRRGMSTLARAQNEKKFSEKFSLYDDGSATASDCRPWDDEGTPSRKIPLVENGIVRSFIYDRETAALAGCPEDGSCTRESYDTPPTLSSSNLVVAPGDWTDIAKEENTYLQVVSMHGMHTANTTSGDFGAEANVAFLRKGNENQPVRGFLITENVFNLFTRVKGVEKYLEQYGNLLLPRMLLEGVSVVS